MLPNKRGSQLSITMERLQMNSRYPLTRIGLSATVGNPNIATKFVAGTKRKCMLIRDKSLRKYNVETRLEKGGISEVADAIASHVTKSNVTSPTLLFANTPQRGRDAGFHTKKQHRYTGRDAPTVPSQSRSAKRPSGCCETAKRE